MSEENYSNQEQDLEPQEQFEELSKTEAMAGVFIAPGETYSTIADSPKKNYWLTPVLIMVVLSLIGTFLFMQDAELANKTMEKTSQKMSEQFDKNVKEGKMTREDADKALDSMNPSSTMFKIFGYGGAVFGSFVILFIPFIIYLIILKIMKMNFEVINVLNVIGLAILIIALGNLISLVISILRGELSTLGLGLLFSEESVGSKLYALLSKIDLFNIWFYTVIGIGINKISGLDPVKSFIVAFVPFVLYLGITFIFG